MAWILKHTGEKIQVKPKNGETFSPREIMDLIGSMDYIVEHIKTHSNQFSGYKIAYNPAEVNNIKRFNIEGTKAVIKGRFSEPVHTVLSIQMRIDKNAFIKKNPNIIFVGGHALAGDYTEFKGL